MNPRPARRTSYRARRGVPFNLSTLPVQDRRWVYEYFWKRAPRGRELRWPLGDRRLSKILEGSATLRRCERLVKAGLLERKVLKETWARPRILKYTITEKAKLAYWGPKPRRSDAHRTGGAGPAAKGSSTPAAPTGTKAPLLIYERKPEG